MIQVVRKVHDAADEVLGAMRKVVDTLKFLKKLDKLNSKMETVHDRATKAAGDPTLLLQTQDAGSGSSSERLGLEP